MFTHSFPFAEDGLGNYWIIDCAGWPETEAPIFYVCHDPPVVTFQCRGMVPFLEAFLSAADAETDPLSEVCAGAITLFAQKRLGLAQAEALASQDPLLREFATDVDDDFVIYDFRQAAPGEGFRWGTHGHATFLKHHPTFPIFAYVEEPDEV